MLKAALCIDVRLAGDVASRAREGGAMSVLSSAGLEALHPLYTCTVPVSTLTIDIRCFIA